VVKKEQHSSMLVIDTRQRKRKQISKYRS